ncbi:hypothetical protein BUB20358_06304 [Burkholderia ubonensis]|nr:hypothetical protein BUB20358_06304 [Burkholderia ubonensis]
MAPREAERVGQQRRMTKAERTGRRAHAVRGFGRAPCGARVGRRRISREVGHRRVGGLQEILVSMRVDGHDAELAGRRRRDRVLLGARGVGLPQRFGRRRARHVPVDRQSVVVQHVDERDVLGRRAEQREVPPQQRHRLAHEVGRRGPAALRVLAEQQVGAREEAFQFDRAACAQRTHARGREPPEVIGRVGGEFGHAGVERVERRIGRHLVRPQRGEQRLLVACARARDGRGGQHAQRGGRHRAAGERERVVRHLHAQVGRALRAQRAEVVEQDRRAGELAQVVPCDRGPEIAQRGPASGGSRLGGDERGGLRQLAREAGRGQPAGFGEHGRSRGQRRGRIIAAIERRLGRREPRVGRPHRPAARVGQCINNGYYRLIGHRGHSRWSWPSCSRCRRAKAPAARRPERNVLRATVRSDLDHLEVFLARAAFRTRPVDRDVFPARARGDALFGQPGFFVVNPATNQAHPALVFHLKPRREGR